MVSAKRFLQNNYFITGMNKLFQDEIGSCISCQANTNTSHFSPLQATKLPERNWDLVSIDFTSKLPNSKYLLVLTDERSRYPILEISKNLTAFAVIKILTKIFKIFGVPNHFRIK